MFFETIHPSLMKFRRNDAAMVLIRICWKKLIPAKETCIDSGVWNFMHCMIVLFFVETCQVQFNLYLTEEQKERGSH